MTKPPREMSRTRFTLRKPGGGRISFSIMKDTLYPDGSRIQRPLPDERVDAVNKALHEGRRDKALAEAELREIIGALYAEEERRRGGRQLFNEENQRLLADYWKQKYEHRDIVGVAQARARLRRALEVCGSKSLLTIERDELQGALKKWKGNRQRDRAAALNQLLKFAGRKFELMLVKPERRRVKFIKLDDMQRLLALEKEEPYRSLFGALFGTGARLGEAFSFVPDVIGQNAIFIDRQLDEDLDERETKNRRDRHAPIIPELRPYVEQWAAWQEKAPYRTEALADRLRALCGKAGLKPLTTRDLRHSYAIHLLSKGVSLSMVAQCLANSITVCQEYYAGFTLTADNVDVVANKL